MEKPILFSTPMVQAILAGQKTMTRRVMKPQPINQPMFCYAGSHKWMHNRWLDKEEDAWFTPPCNTDDILWVRETWTYHEGATGGIIFKARCPEKLAATKKWKPSIFMPREACRLFLKVTNVRVERLQGITEEDAKAEGTQPVMDALGQIYSQDGFSIGYRLGFEKLWDSINTKRGYGWDTNPWAWVIEFERVQP